MRRDGPGNGWMDGMAEIVLVRHGQTEWSLTGKHTSYTDIELTTDGERQAREIGARLGRPAPSPR